MSRIAYQSVKTILFFQVLADRLSTADAASGKHQSRTKKAVFLTMITTYGIAKNQYAHLVPNEVLLDDLFA